MYVCMQKHVDKGTRHSNLKDSSSKQNNANMNKLDMKNKTQKRKIRKINHTKSKSQHSLKKCISPTTFHALTTLTPK